LSRVTTSIYGKSKDLFGGFVIITCNKLTIYSDMIDVQQVS
jgi:hypothetical protein